MFHRTTRGNSSKVKSSRFPPSLGLTALLVLAGTLTGFTAASNQWAAFNDQTQGPLSSLRDTFLTVSLFGPNSGLLKDSSSGVFLPASLVITNDPGVQAAPTMSAPFPGTPAYTVFNSYIDWIGSAGTNGVQIFPTNTLGYIFSGLDPAKQYTFVATSIRGGTTASAGNEYSNRWTQAELVGALSYTQSHSANVIDANQYPGALTGSQAAWNAGVNSTPSTGDIVKWDNIVPAPDGTFIVLCKKYNGPFPGGSAANGLYSFAFTALRLGPTPFGISSQPQDVTVTPGDTVSLSVGAFGSPPLSYQWSKNGTNISGATNLTYAIPNATSADEGTYAVLVSNVNGSVPSSNAVVQVGFYPIAIAADPQDQIVNEGATVSLSVGVSGALPYFFQWFKDGQLLPGATNRSLTITNASSADAAPYFVVVSDRFSDAISREAVVNVFSPSAAGMMLLRFADSWRYNPSGTDLGSAWKESVFDDSLWPAGQGVFYNFAPAIPQPGNTALYLTNTAGSYVSTYYFRTHFNWPLTTTNAFLIASNLLDDGAVYYLNGVEAARLRIPAGPVAYSTLATNAPNSGTTYEMLVFPSTAMSPGDNVLAVEVHQSSLTNVDLVFGLSLKAAAKNSELARITVSPGDQTVNEEQPVLFAAEVFGTPPLSFQWFKDGSSIPGATNQTLKIFTAHPFNAGDYTLQVANRFNAALSGKAHLTVIPDNQPPSITSVRANDLTTVVVTFSEAIELTSATYLGNYTFNPALVISKIQLVNPNTVVLTTGPRDSQLDYTLTVNGVADLAIPANAVGPGVPLLVRRANASTIGGLAGIQTVFMIIMENKDWANIKGNTNCPYLNSLLPQASYCEQYRSPHSQHPSEPSYIWIEGGTNFGYTTDAGPTIDRIANSNHLSTLLYNNGIEWRGYMESMPYGSIGTANIGQYAGRHNPFSFFDDVTTNYDYCTSHVRPYASFAGDLAANRIGRYNFITPNLTNDMHSLATGSSNATHQGDVWLSRELPQILNSTAFSNNGAVFIFWDESGGTSTNPCGMIVLSPLAKGNGYVNNTPLDHSSTLRTMQDIFGVRPYLGAALEAENLGDLFMDMALSPGMLSGNGQYQFNLTNLIPGRSYYIQASANLVNWSTISTNFTSNGSLSITDPSAVNSPARFYRAIQVQ